MEFIFAKISDFDGAKAATSLSSIVMLAAMAGLVICAYSWLMIHESAKHIKANWRRANQCAQKLTWLTDLLRDSGGGRQPIMIWDQVLVGVVAFVSAFLISLGWAIGNEFTASRTHQDWPLPTTTNAIIQVAPPAAANVGGGL